MFKAIKTVMRKFLHIFGFDIVPYKPPVLEGPVEPVKKPADDEFDLELYREIYGEEAVRENRFYNIGAGGFIHPAWRNVDKLSEWYAGVQDRDEVIDWDIMALQPLPIPDNSAEIIYTSYTLEHVPDEGVLHVLKEARRTLKPGGVLRVIVPDIEIYYRALRRGDRTFYAKPNRTLPEEYERVSYNQNPNKGSLQQNFLWQFASSASIMHIDGAPERVSDEEFERVFAEMAFEDALDYCKDKASWEVQMRHPGNHINWFTESKLLGMFKQAGFEQPYRSGYEQSVSPVLRNMQFFDHRSPKEGLFVEALK